MPLIFSHLLYLQVMETTGELSGYQIIDNPEQVPARLMASGQVKIETKAIDQALDLLRRPGLEKAVKEMVMTPDLHVGTGIPVGVIADITDKVVPSMIGRDIGCGMRLLVVEGVSAAEISRHRARLETRLRQIFFEGARELYTSSRQRESIFRDGLHGLLQTIADNAGQGLWQLYDPDQAMAELPRVHGYGRFATEGVFAGYRRYMTGSDRMKMPDSQLGSLGGGNHFAELDRVDRIFEGATAHAWGLHEDDLVIFVHSGSLSIGAAAHDQLGDPHQPLEVGRPDAGIYLQAMHNAANFAFANRLSLGLMMLKALTDVLHRPLTTQLVYDAPHNFIESTADVWRHRKGATPSLGPESKYDQETFPSGHPVLIPGSMGSAGYVMIGTGSRAALESTAHGAGRALSRGRAARKTDPELQGLQVVTPTDLRRMCSLGRHDIADEQEKRIREEAPSAYKDIETVIDATEIAGAARRVAALEPLLTVKG